MEEDYIDLDELKRYKGLQIVQLNIRSLQHKVKIIEQDLLTSRIGVLGVTETWLNRSTPNTLVNIEGYKLLRNDRHRCKGGGTCMYIRDNFEFEIPKDGVSDREVEIQSAIITGRDDNRNYKPILIVLIYRPPNGNNIIALDIIKEYINGISDYEKKEIVIMGDLNWDVQNEKSTGTKFVNEIVDDFGLKQLIMHPTRVTSRCSTLIDLIMTNMKNVAYAGCLNY